MTGNDKKNYLLADFKLIPAVPCPCGQAKRAFIEPESKIASFHIVEISKNSQSHYHKKMTEIYHVIEGEGILELDDDRIDLKPGITVMIKPGCLHRAVGQLKIINVPIPTFDPEDEWFPSE
jgi:mannose-6-phosphate isomerase-like protein (cupin superfamily)